MRYFEDCGLVVGLISYPYDVDGHDLYKDIFEDGFFKKYKSDQEYYASDNIDRGFYEPKGYRLFGDYGLAVISLIDDFAFCNSVFHSEHGYNRTEAENPSSGDTTKSGEKESKKKKYVYSCHVITGVTTKTESKQSCGNLAENNKTEWNPYLIPMAEKTFNAQKEKYPFIGITKLKVRNELLIGTGIDFTESIKKCIIELSDEHQKSLEVQTDLETIVIDCFDSNELTLLTFSNNMSEIHRFNLKVREIKVEDLKEFDCTRSLLFKQCRNMQEEKDKDMKNPCSTSCRHYEKCKDKLNEGENRDIEKEINKSHVFSSTHTSLGYDIKFDFKDNDPNKLEIPGSSSSGSGFSPLFKTATGLETVELNLRWEIKPGHVEEFMSVMGENPNRGQISMIGGNTLLMNLPIVEIHRVERYCKDKEIAKHIRKLKVRLSAGNKDLDQAYCELGHQNPPKLKYEFTDDDLDGLRKNLDRCGVSKILRERLLKLYGLFNNCISDPMHTVYFLELRGALNKILKMMNDFAGNEKENTKDIIKCISESISSFEEACYNRLYETNIKDTNLEYNGGIQQYLTSFDWAYKQILECLMFEKNKVDSLASYVFVSGYESVSSGRSNLRININHITYPELFLTCVWKEAANFAFISNPELDDPRPTPAPAVEHYQRKYKTWYEFIERDTLKEGLLSALSSEDFDRNDGIYQIIFRMMGKELLEYIYTDLMIYHFGFNRNFELLYHSYWKYFLQISQHYKRNGQVNENMFLAFLFRLFMISFSDKRETYEEEEKSMKNYLKEKRYEPFDSSLSDLWMSGFMKTYKCAKVIWKEINKFYFKEILLNEVAALERKYPSPYLTPKMKGNPKENDYAFLYYCRLFRKSLIDDCMKDIRDYRLVEPDASQDATVENEFMEGPHYIISLLNAYLTVLKNLDEESKAPIRHMPRDRDGQAYNQKEKLNVINDLKKEMIPVAPDPLGGMCIKDFLTRRKYFAYRTTLYRSLWNYAMKSKKESVIFDDQSKSNSEHL